MTYRRETLVKKKCECSQTHLQFLGPFVAKRLQGETEVVVVGQRAQVEVVLGVDAGWDVDVELEQLQEVTLHLIPAERGNKGDSQSKNSTFFW